MSIASITTFVTVSLVLVGLALALLLVTVGVAAFQFFAANRPVRQARQESIRTYYRQAAFS
ncbi:hypothetical protein IGS73_13855 [Janibacter indicus]|uniref:Uncharacterized protein n=1 Tax=Janibacter indicus TaxID=857417 RepID=A0A1L3MIW0_9MICO|nr:hypothetical protein [Janibacter indicus]APH02230.1 hypothetical protein ASJ30_12400 [Janibacter indicus]QOK22168.1 hypothetical protein IGS73_13855 [Janibacter indicus]